MAAAARVIEARLGKSPFSDPVASGVARNAWRQIIHNLTSDPLEGEIVTEHLRIIDEMISLKPPSFPPSPKDVGLSVGFDEWVRDKEEKNHQYGKEIKEYEHQILEYRTKLERLNQKILEFADIANEAAKSGLSFPEHR
jgi:hypothetical protein